MRGAVYIDAFNMYHAIDDLGRPYLKWINLWKLGQTIAKGHAKPIVKVVFCTAYRRGDTGKKARHRCYVKALELVGVNCKFGHETMEPGECPDCGFNWETPREKATDINLALSVYEDALDDVFDVAFLVTADTDQAATFAFVKARFPQKRLIIVTPPGRALSKHLFALADGKIQLSERMLDEAVMPAFVTNGVDGVDRPPEYAPPPGWIHPNDRPTG